MLCVAASRPKALAMADGQTIAKLRLTLPPGTTDWLPEHQYESPGHTEAGGLECIPFFLRVTFHDRTFRIVPT
jgi:hypothetical protein